MGRELVLLTLLFKDMPLPSEGMSATNRLGTSCVSYMLDLIVSAFFCGSLLLQLKPENKGVVVLVVSFPHSDLFKAEGSVKCDCGVVP